MTNKAAVSKAEDTAVRQALSSLKAHGGKPEDLGLPKGAVHSGKDVIEACAKFLDGQNHKKCAQGLRELPLEDAPPAADA